MDFIKYDNVKKISKITRISKRLIRFAYEFDYDLGYRGHDLSIAFDGNDICKPHVDIRRNSFGLFGCFKFGGTNNETKWFNTANEAVLEAMMWLSEMRRA